VRYCRLDGEENQGVKPNLKRLVRYFKSGEFMRQMWLERCQAGSALIFRNISSNFAHI